MADTDTAGASPTDDQGPLIDLPKLLGLPSSWSATPDQTQGGMLSQLGNSGTNPGIMALLGAARGFGAAAMPTRFRGGTPMGAAIGMGAAGAGEGANEAYRGQLEQAQAQQAQIQAQLSGMTLPVARAKLAMQLDALRNPQKYMGIFGGAGGTGDTSAATPQPQPGGKPGATSALTPFVGQNLPQGVSPAEDQMVRTIWGEARGEPLAGQQGVAAVIKNRMRLGGQSAQDVIFAPHQFEPWNDPKTRAQLEGLDPNAPEYQGILNNAVRPIMNGQVADPTGGATHFVSPSAQEALGRSMPDWAQGSRTTIGKHDFYYPGYPGPQPASTAAAATPTPGPYQTAQAGTGVQPPPTGGATPAAPAATGGGAAATPGTAGPQSLAMPPGVAITPQAAMQQYQRMMQAAQYGDLTGLPMFGDPATLRQSAQTFLKYALAPSQATLEAAAKANVELQTAPTIAGLKKAAEAPFDIHTGRPGSIFMDANGNLRGVVPFQSEEQLPDGRFITVMRNPYTGETMSRSEPHQTALPIPESGNVVMMPNAQGGAQQGGGGTPSPGGAGAAAGNSGLPPGAFVRQQSPELTERLKTAGQLPGELIKHDLQETTEDTTDALALQQNAARYYEMRAIAPKLATGSGAEWRTAVSNFVQTYIGNMGGQWGERAATWLKNNMGLPDAALAQEFTKLATQAVTGQESAMHARGGVALTKLLAQANPNLSNQPDANVVMVNLLLAQNQMLLDYARGHQSFVNGNIAKFQASHGQGDYTPGLQFDKNFINDDNQKTYLAAALAMSGRPPADWQKLLGGDKGMAQQTIDIIRRIDPTTQVMFTNKATGKPEPYSVSPTAAPTPQGQ